MKQASERQAERIKQRRERQEQNLFSRLPAAYAASRLQAQRLLQRAGGLSVLEWRVLWDLCEAGPMTIRDLAEIQRTDHSQLSRALPAMQRKQFVTMTRDSSDGRQIVVEITDTGRRAYETTAPTMKLRRDALRAEFSPEEIATFISLLDRLEDFLRRPIDTFLEREPPE
ncbi:DNA-binding MarR family transcriptional regulator [Hoeflea halophila]|uniref:DNA-binding MarR family transcriptional regulator n=1 Tax=Hoeflea halophila TaxID=714899 RepID=A0A286IE59_9HYPH|nr:MarR family transcriptional regulator [Hoeflea halophila]SOE18415.1 DNA-binding MarR family transcriptional regulator [Hoeflea halophila]